MAELAAVRSSLMRNRVGLLGLIVVGCVVVLAIFAPVIAPYAPNDTVTRRFAAPSDRFWLGADEFGRDVLSRIVHGARVSIYVGLVSVGIGLLVGAAAGITAGYFGGVLDNVLMRLADMLFSIPSIVLAIGITSVLGPSLTNAMLAIGIVYTPAFARIARAPVLVAKETQFVEAARAIGAGHRRIIARHIVPNIMAPLIVQTTFSLSTAILTESALSFLGLGIQPPDPSWGTMLSGSRTFMELAWWLAVFPGLAIMLAVMGFNLLGDGLRDMLDPRLRVG